MPAIAAPHAPRNGRFQQDAPVAPRGRSYIRTDTAPVGAGHARDRRPHVHRNGRFQQDASVAPRAAA